LVGVLLLDGLIAINFSSYLSIREDNNHGYQMERVKSSIYNEFQT
jgi:hypothetical protein